MISEMEQDIHFNLYRHVFKNDPLFNKLGDMKYANEYAHKIIVDAFSVGTGVELAYEAIVVLSFWMEVIHLLEASARNCENVGKGATQHPGFTIDEALAYYVGVGQSKGKTDGYLLYAFAQKSASAFGTLDQETGEAKVNKELMDLFKQAKNLAVTCNGEETVTKSLRSVVGVMVSRMNVPLVQSFYQTLQIGAQTDKGSFYATLYGLAALPQIATCQPVEYQYLSNEITENGLDVANIEDLMKSLKSTFNCFGVTCADVFGGTEDCGNIPNVYAGFEPFDDVREVRENLMCMNGVCSWTTIIQCKFSINLTLICSISKFAIIDRDVLKIEALILEDAFQAAENYYIYGFHLTSAQPPSLRDLTNDPTLQTNSFFNAIKLYHGSSTFADNMILSAIRGSMQFIGASSMHRRDAVLSAIQTLVLLPAAIGNMYRATSCEKLLWEKGASYLIGSVEGTDWGGDKEKNGVGMYNLAKELCHNSGTCAIGNNALSNDKLFDYFSAGEQFIAGERCEDLTEFMDNNVVPLLLATLIQGVIEYSDDANRSKAYVLGQAIIPFVAQANNDTATETILANTILEGDGSKISVLNAFASVIEPMGLDCKDILEELCMDYYDSNDNTDLSDGLYITTTYVENKAKIDLDIEFIRQELLNGNIEAARNVYNKVSWIFSFSWYM